MKIYIGYDVREAGATNVAVRSLLKLDPTFAPELLSEHKLRAQGLLTRNVDQRGGQDYDLPSNAHASTRFAISRFLVPIICQSRWALFVDADVVFLEDPREMLTSTVKDRDKAVYVVKHNHQPTDTWKMVNQRQAPYPRKNWSSVMLFDCDHPANRRLTLNDVNTRPGRDLHQFYWLADEEIGELHQGWNWLVGEAPRPEPTCIAHFTRGGPWIPGWVPAEHDDIWLNARDATS